MDCFDLVVVGAGIHGLAAAKAYKDVNSFSSILVIDKDSSVGGVWSNERLYPGLKTNNHFGSFEFSDFPMSDKGMGSSPHIPGQVVHNYLYQYAEHFDLLSNIKFRTKVIAAEERPNASGWNLDLETADEALRTVTSSRIWCAKLIVATGLTSEPLLPTFEGQDSFDAPIYHSSAFARHLDGLGPFKRVVVMSGAKFSWDVASAYASAGVQVDWVIRASGHGPCWMAPGKLTPFKVTTDRLVITRLIAWLSPCIWAQSDGFDWCRSFLHRTWLGRKIVAAIYFLIAKEILDHNAYDKHPETAKLKPWDDVFWVATNRGILNYNTDVFEQIRSGKIRVHIADITHLSARKVHLSNDTALDADVLVCGTGWKHAPPIAFKNTGDLGLPELSTTVSSAHTMRADREILDTLPRLADQPPARPNLKPTTLRPSDNANEPYRLYRFMVPASMIEKRTLAFAGALRSPATTIIAQTQGLWIAAFLEGKLPHLQQLDSAARERIQYETVLHSQYGKWRYPKGFGGRFPDIWTESLPYVELMLKELGLKFHRKSSLLKECFEPYGVDDYRGVTEEWQMNQKKLLGEKV